jgi:hypothetical protein
MFTLTKASQIFPETLAADAVPAITARFRLLSAEDQLALIWYAYLEMGTTITIAAPGAARMQFAEPVLAQIKAMDFAGQSQVMCDLANSADTAIGRTYANWSVNIKLGFWYQLGQWMAAGLVAPIPEGYQLSANAATDWKHASSNTGCTRYWPPAARSAAGRRSSAKTERPSGDKATFAASARKDGPKWMPREPNQRQSSDAASVVGWRVRSAATS